MSTVVNLTRELVEIPSHEDESAAGDAIEAWLRRETDADVTRDETGSVFARRGEGDVSFALVGHHDVVPPADRQVDDEGNYVVGARDGRLYGRGTADMKGSVAAAMCAFRDADRNETSCELLFVSFVGEEIGGAGARAAIDEGFAPDYALVGEGSTNYSGEDVTDVVVAHKGRRASTIVARGEASHASVPESGQNAVYRACDAVDLVRGMTFPEADVLGERLRGSVAVTEIDGGSAWNVVPDHCSVTVDERTVPGDHVELEAVEDIEGVEWTVDQDLPPMECDDEAVADAVLAAAREGQDADPKLVTKPHATDAGWLSQAGTTCVVCGASEPGEAHTESESVSIEVLERCYRIYRNAAERVGGGRDV